MKPNAVAMRLLAGFAVLLAGCGESESGVVSGGPMDAAGATGGADGSGGAAVAEDAPSEAPLVPCALGSDDCASPGKCSVVIGANRYESVCVPAGAGRVEEPCERSAVGLDDCAPGLFCTAVALPRGVNSTMSCRPLCQENTACDNGQRCYRFSTGQPEVFGVCVPPCVFFETECGEGYHCLPVLDASSVPMAICSEYGPAGEGEPCVSADDCGENLACATPEGRCRAYCSNAQWCGRPDRTCEPLGLASFPGLGVCITQ